MNLTQLSLKQAHDGLVNKEFTSVDLTRACFEVIKNTDSQLHALLTTDEAGALAQAALVDAKIARGEAIGMLEGIPATVKDILCTKGVRTTAGSKMLENYVPIYDATTVEKIKNAGAVILGKNNLDAWAHGGSTENSDFGPTKNPHDTTRVPGGSSGGSAASVAAFQSFYSLGSDTGGSIRQPASFCGVVGLKPTYGRVSRFGSVAMGSSLDTIGPLARTVEDAAYILSAIAGKDPKDATTFDVEVPDYVGIMNKGVEKFAVGVPKQLYALLPADAKEVFDASLKKLEQAGGVISEIDMKYLKYGIATYYIIMPSEVSSNLGRFDGVRYGHRDMNATALYDMYINSRSQGFGDEAKRRIMIGTYVLSAGYYDAYYKKAMKVRTLIKQEFEDLFTSFDVIATPTTLGPAFKLGEKNADPLSMYLEDIFTVTANIAGIPGISVPSGTIDGMPVGLQLMSAQNTEGKLLAIAKAFEDIQNKK